MVNSKCKLIWTSGYFVNTQKSDSTFKKVIIGQIREGQLISMTIVAKMGLYFNIIQRYMKCYSEIEVETERVVSFT